MALKSKGSNRGSGGDLNIYSALLGAASLALLVAVIWVAMANMEQSSAGGMGGSMFDLVSSR